MYPAIVPRLSNGGKELGAFPLLLIIVSYPRAETSQRAKPRQKRRGDRGRSCATFIIETGQWRIAI